MTGIDQASLMQIFMKPVIFIIMMSLAATNDFAQTPRKSEIVSLNGTNIYYEVYGAGKPLFLLHGYTMSSQSWHPYVADFANDFEVYLVDLRGHGRSGKFTEKLSIRSVARDVDELARYLQLDSISAIGFSFGGDVLFQLALMHPGLVRSMVIIGSCGSWNAQEFPKWLEYLSYRNIDNLPWMREQQTNEDQIRSILDQLQNYNISVSEEELKNIRARTLLVYGDQEDSVTWECILSAKKNIPGSQLWVLPNTPHRAFAGNNSSEFVRVSKEFLGQGWSK